MEKETKTVEKTVKNTTKKAEAKTKPLVPEVKSVMIEITQDDANSLSNIHDYLHSRPVNETEGGVFFIRNLLNKINESA